MKYVTKHVRHGIDAFQFVGTMNSNEKSKRTLSVAVATVRTVNDETGKESTREYEITASVPNATSKESAWKALTGILANKPVAVRLPKLPETSAIRFRVSSPALLGKHVAILFALFTNGKEMLPENIATEYDAVIARFVDMSETDDADADDAELNASNRNGSIVNA